MAIKGYCGGDCGNEKRCEQCRLDLSIPCSPNCENLTEEGNIKIKNCLADKCEVVKYIFDMVRNTDEEILKAYGDVAPYPYDIQEVI